MHAATGERYPHVRVHKRIRYGHPATQLGSPARAGGAHDTVCTTACRTSHDLPVQPGVIPLGRQPVSPTPSAPRRRGAHDPGHAPGQENAAVTGSSPGAPGAGQPARRQPGQRQPGSRLRRWVPRAVLLAGVLMATAGCESTTFTRLGLPVPVTKQGEVVVTLWRGSWIAALCVGDVVWGAILWAVIFHRKRTDAAAAAGPLQPADRDHVHGHPVHHGRRLLLLHRPGRELHRQAPAAPGRHRDRDRLPVELGVPVPGVQGAGLGERGRLRDRGRPGRAGCRCWRSPRTGPSASTSSRSTWCTRSGSSRSSSSGT